MWNIVRIRKNVCLWNALMFDFCLTEIFVHLIFIITFIINLAADLIVRGIKKG